MTATPHTLLFAYAAAVFAVSILGGRFSEHGAMTHMRTQVVMSLVAGFLLGIALFHLMPHGIERIPGPDAMHTAAMWIVIGMVAMVVLLRVFPFHQHDFSAEGTSTGSHGGIQASSLVGVVVGLSLHTVTEGVALGASVRVGLADAGLLPGLGVCLAIVLHKALDAYSIIGMMKQAGIGRRARTMANIGYALLCPAVAIATYFGAGMVDAVAEGPLIGRALAFAVGAFLCISLSDLLPEIHFHRHDRVKLLAALFAGVGLAYALHLVEAAV